jgi:hypothetical protein
LPNARAVATSQQVIVAADITQRSNDSGQLEPMIRQGVQTLTPAGIDAGIGTVLADGGYWNNPHIVALGDEWRRPATRARRREQDRLDAAELVAQIARSGSVGE